MLASFEKEEIIMKKLAAYVLSAAMVLSLAACGSQGNGDDASDILPSGGSVAEESKASGQPDETGISDEGNGTDSEPEDSNEGNAADSGQDASVPGETEPNQESDGTDSSAEAGAGKTLVVYYSATGHTENVAQYIAAATDGDLFLLEPVETYTSEDLDWTDENSRVVYEHDNPEARAVELAAVTVEDWESYDTVFIGYPIWWHIAAWPVNSFVSANDFTGKTVVPFCTSSRSGLGESGELLAEEAGTGNWLTGERFSSSVSEETVREWVEGLEL